MYTLILYDVVYHLYVSFWSCPGSLAISTMPWSDWSRQRGPAALCWLDEGVWQHLMGNSRCVVGPRKIMYRYGLMEIDVPQIGWFIYSACMCLWWKILWKGMMTRGTPMTMETSIYVKMQQCILGRLDKFYGQPLSSSLGIWGSVPWQ